MARAKYTTGTIEERFWPKVDRRGPEECWEWKAGRVAGGYGAFNPGKRGLSRLAHRVAWELLNGPILEGLHACHHCDNPPRCNPAHLFLGTDADNLDDMRQKGRRTYARGESASNVKLKTLEVLEIRRLYRPGDAPRLASRFSVVGRTIHDIVNRKTWAHV